MGQGFRTRSPLDADSDLSPNPSARPGAGDCDLPRRLSTGPSPRCLEGSGTGELDRPRKLSTGPRRPLLSAVGDARPRKSRLRPCDFTSGTGDCERPRRLSTGPRPIRPPECGLFPGEGALPFSISTGPKPRFFEGGLSGAGDFERPRKLSTGPSMPLSADGEGTRALVSPLLLVGDPSVAGAGDCPRPRRLSTGPSVALPEADAPSLR